LLVAFLTFGASLHADCSAVLDLGGGRGERLAWGLAFVSLGVVKLLGVIPARRLARHAAA
jgi:hypothetical protein